MKKSIIFILIIISMFCLTSCMRQQDVPAYSDETSNKPLVQKPSGIQTEDTSISSLPSVVITAGESSAQQGTSDKQIEINCIKLDTDTGEFELVNNSMNDWGFGYTPYFQKEMNGQWFDVQPVTDIAVPEIYALLPANGGRNKFVLPISQWYGRLSEGKYRTGIKLTGELGEQMLWYEFDVDIISD